MNAAPASLVAGDGEVVAAMGPKRLLPVAPAATTAAASSVELQRTGPSVGLAQAAALRSPMANALAAAVAGAVLPGAGEVLPSRVHGLEAQVLRPIVVVEVEGLRTAVREVVPQRRRASPTAPGGSAPIPLPRPTGVPTADGRQPMGQEGLATVGPAQVAELPAHVLVLASQAAGLRADDAAQRARSIAP